MLRFEPLKPMCADPRNQVHHNRDLVSAPGILGDHRRRNDVLQPTRKPRFHRPRLTRPANPPLVALPFQLPHLIDHTGRGQGPVQQLNGQFPRGGGVGGGDRVGCRAMTRRSGAGAGWRASGAVHSPQLDQPVAEGAAVDGDDGLPSGDYAVGDNAVDRNAPRLALTAALAEHVQRVRMLGTASVDLAWVAHGRLDAAVMMSNKPWDTAPGAVIAKEAGALVLDLGGRPHSLASRSIVAVTPSLAPALLELVQSASAG